MKLEANFTKISTEFQDLDDGEYIGTVESVEYSETKENKLPMLTYDLKVTSGQNPDMVGRSKKDFVVLKQKDGKNNDVGLGRIKAYEIARAGEAAGNSDSIDTDLHKNISVRFVVTSKMEKDRNAPNGPEVKRSQIAKVLPV